MFNRKFLLGFAALSTIAASTPASVEAPSFKVGDFWVYDQAIEHGTQGYDQQRLDFTIQRTGAETMLVGMKRDGAPGAYEDHLLGSDWSIRRVVNGQEATTARPFAFPMTVGQTWTEDFVDPTRRGAQISLHVHRTYKVAGWEDVTVPAGTFHAIKVEASGLDQGSFAAPNTAVGGVVSSLDGAATLTQSRRGGTKLLNIRSHDELYYVPEVKNYVKSVEEQYNTDDVLVQRQTRTLVQFRPGS